MDFLDPRLRKSNNIRLAVGYVLLTLVIGLVSLIVAYGAYGYGINTKTGQIIQNGLLFVDSQPAAAQISLNGHDAGTATASRMVIPAGNYILSVKKSGYTDWQRSFTLDEHAVARFDYLLLFPSNPVISILKSYSSQPKLVAQSPDRRWLVLQSPDGTFDVYDMNDLTKTPQNISLPADIFGDSGASQNFSAVEWASDNNHLLLEHTIAGGHEFIMLNRSKPDQSVNLNKLLGTTPSQVFLRNQKTDQAYFYDQSTGTVSLADLSKPSLGQPILSQVLAFKSFNSSLAAYVTSDKAPAGMAAVRLFDGGKTYPLSTVALADRYFIDAGQFNGHWYYAVGSSAQPRINIYKDPLSALESKPAAKATPLGAIGLPDAQVLSFSPGSRFIEAEKGSSFAVYDLYTQKSYSYTLPTPIDSPLRWLDAAHLTGEANRQLMVMDYDSLNTVTPAATAEPGGGYLSRDLHHMLTVETAPSGGYQLVNIDMRAGSDLPKQP